MGALHPRGLFRPRLVRGFSAIGIAGLAWAAAGWRLALDGSAWTDPRWALGIRGSSLVAVLAVLGWRPLCDEFMRWTDREERLAPLGAGLVAACALGVGIAFGTFAAAGADASGYVSQARLWGDGRLVRVEPLAATAPWPNAHWSFAPLGYRPGQEPGAIVPTYPPGLPMVMALASAAAGNDAAYWVVPILGFVAVWCTFVLGRATAGGGTGLLAAVLVCTSPIFLFQIVQPMSDVPVAAWWLLAIVLARSRTVVGVLGSGLAAGAAVLTRPNLVALALPVAVVIVGDSTRRSRRRLTAYTVGLLPGVAGVAWLHTFLYGSPLTALRSVRRLVVSSLPAARYSSDRDLRQCDGCGRTRPAAPLGARARAHRALLPVGRRRRPHRERPRSVPAARARTPICGHEPVREPKAFRFVGALCGPGKRIAPALYGPCHGSVGSTGARVA